MVCSERVGWIDDDEEEGKNCGGEEEYGKRNKKHVLTLCMYVCMYNICRFGSITLRVIVRVFDVCACVCVCSVNWTNGEVLGLWIGWRVD